MIADLRHAWRSIRRMPIVAAVIMVSRGMGIMLVLLLAVCGNTVNLLLARASVRQREVGMRLALGASPSRVAMLLMGEALMLSVLGATVGIAIAAWATDALRAVPMITAFPIKFQTRVDGPILSVAGCPSHESSRASRCSRGLGPARPNLAAGPPR